MGLIITPMNELTEGIKNWKLRLILSALLCIMGLAAMISMVMGLIVELSVYDKTLVAVAVFMVGVPAYLIISGLAKIDEHTIAHFLNENVDSIKGDAILLARSVQELSEEEIREREQLKQFLSANPVYQLLPDKPVKQAYFLMLISLIISFGIWYFA